MQMLTATEDEIERCDKIPESTLHENEINAER